MEHRSIQYRVLHTTRLLKIINLLLQHNGFFVGHFNTDKNKPVLTRNTLPIRVDAFRTKGKITERKSLELARTVRTPEILPRVRPALIRSPTQSSRQTRTRVEHGRESVRKILRQDQKFHSYKMQMK